MSNPQGLGPLGRGGLAGTHGDLKVGTTQGKSGRVLMCNQLARILEMLPKPSPIGGIKLWAIQRSSVTGCLGCDGAGKFNAIVVRNVVVVRARPVINL